MASSTNGHVSLWIDSTMSLVVNWSELSPRGTAIMRQVGTRMAEGYTTSAIASELLTSNSSILRLIAELQDELRQLS